MVFFVCQLINNLLIYNIVMEKTYKNQLATLFAFCALALFASTPLFASASNDSDSDKVTADEALEMLEQARDAVADATDAIEADEANRADLFEYAEEYLAKAETAYEEEDYDETAEWSEKTISKVAYILDGDSEKNKNDESDESDEGDKSDDNDKDGDSEDGATDDEEKDVWTEEKCASNPGIGHGVKKKCDADYKKDDSHKKEDKYKNYGKSQDVTELRMQLQELMQLLIQLLTMQLAQQTANQ
jgi:hypothetical protein